MKALVLSEDEIASVLVGEVPDGRADLAELATAVGGLRHAYLTGPPTPSAELLDRLRGSGSARTAGAEGAPAGPTQGSGVRPATSGPGIAVKWLVGLGMGAKLGLGSTVVAVGLAGAGATGVLPDRAQSIVVDVINELNPFDHDIDRAEEQAPESDTEPGPPVSVDRPRTETGDQGAIEQTPRDSGLHGDGTHDADPDDDPGSGPGEDSDGTDDPDPDADPGSGPGEDSDGTDGPDPDADPGSGSGEDGDGTDGPDPDVEPDVDPDADPDADSDGDRDGDPDGGEPGGDRDGDPGGGEPDGDPDGDRPEVGQEQSDSDSSGG